MEGKVFAMLLDVPAAIRVKVDSVFSPPIAIAAGQHRSVAELNFNMLHTETNSYKKMTLPIYTNQNI
jgi:hypothetical protein